MKTVPELIAEFEAWLKSFFSHPDVVAAVTSAPTSIPNSAPAGVPVIVNSPVVTIPGTDRQIDAVTAAYLGVSEQTSKILNDRANAPVTGSVNNAPSWDSFDGHNCFSDFPAGQPVSFTVTGSPVSQGFTLGWYEVVGGTPCQMGVSVTRDGSPVDAPSSSGAGNGGNVQVPAGSGSVVVSLTAPVATKWGIGIKP